MELPEVSFAVGVQGFEELNARRNNDGTVPVLGALAVNSGFLFKIKIAMVFEDGAIAEDIAESTSRLFNNTGVWNDDDHPVKLVDGSVAKGETLAKTGGSGTTLACGICHGPALKGVGPIPPIAGRSPTYIVRQLYEFKTGGRSADASALMKQAVEKLSPEDIIALAAYVGSLEP